LKRVVETARRVLTDRCQPDASADAVLTLEQEQAEAIDDGKLHGCSQDEKEIHAFTGLCYSPERHKWLARFQNAIRADWPPQDLTHAEVLELGRSWIVMQTKPSQCFRAAAAFNAHLDREVQKLKLG